jgi:hypothetical protein
MLILLPAPPMVGNPELLERVGLKNYYIVGILTIY